jgi:copper homeostasis protein
MPVRLEVCVGSAQSALRAQMAGASRVELCSQLEVGGLTPSFGAIKAATALEIPVHILIRPRTGGFVYSEIELRIIEADIEAVGRLGCAGVVIGMLTLQSEVAPVLHRVVKLAKQWSLSVTFHRAFDDLNDMQAGIETIIAAGCDRVLTSGGKPSTDDQDARATIKSLIDQAGGRIVVMPGAGVSLENVASLVAETGAREVHASCKKTVTSEENSIFRSGRWETDETTIRRMCHILDEI